MTGTELETVFIKACANVVQNSVLEEVLTGTSPNSGCRPIRRRTGVRPEDLRGDRPVGAEPGPRPVFRPRRKGRKEAARRLRERPLADEVLPYGQSEFVLPGSTDVGDVSWNVPTGQVWWPPGRTTLRGTHGRSPRREGCPSPTRGCSTRARCLPLPPPTSWTTRP